MSTSKLIRWSGLAAMVGGLLYATHGVITYALGLTIDNLPGVAMTGGWVFWSTVSLAAFVLILLGLVGLYLRQSEAAGTLGFVGFLVAFIGQALIVGDPWVSSFLVPALAKGAPALVEAMAAFEGPSPYLEAVMVSWGIQNLGWIVFAIATMRARVLPRWGALLLIVGLLLGLPGMVATVFWHIAAVVFGVGLLWLGYAVWSGASESAG